MGVILREVIPDGTQWGKLGDILPHWNNLEFGQDLKGASSISFDYANDGAHFEKLKNGIFVVPEVNGNRKWRNSIFYIRERSGSLMPGAESKTTKFAGVSLRGRLEFAHWLPAVGSVYMTEDMFKYSNVTPGAVIKAGVENYLSRARNLYKDPSLWVAEIVEGSADYWKYRVDETIEPTTTVEEVVSKYQDLGIGTVQFEGFNLTTVQSEWFSTTPAEDKISAVQLKVGLNLKEGEYGESMDGMYTAVFVKGAQDPFSDEEDKPTVVQWVVADQGIIDKYGYHEHVLNVSDAASAETLKAVGENFLRLHMEPRMSRSYTMVDNLADPTTGRKLPVPTALVDFQCGDTITVFSEDGPSSEKVYAITMSYSDNADQPSIGLTLNDYFDEWEVTFDQRLRRLGG